MGHGGYIRPVPGRRRNQSECRRCRAAGYPADPDCTAEPGNPADANGSSGRDREADTEGGGAGPGTVPGGTDSAGQSQERFHGESCGRDSNASDGAAGEDPGRNPGGTGYSKNPGYRQRQSRGAVDFQAGNGYNQSTDLTGGAQNGQQAAQRTEAGVDGTGEMDHGGVQWNRKAIPILNSGMTRLSGQKSPAFPRTGSWGDMFPPG